ncbi:MAG: chloride channel protein [Pirellulales bacterium]|nr:chloride channel protein [Pirellulales bacterium]
MEPPETSSIFRVLVRWFPDFLIRGSKRARAQLRILALSVIVGVVAGLGAIVFYIATRGVEYYALESVVGYSPSPRPAGEPENPKFEKSTTSLRPWLLLIVPTLGGLACGFLVYTFAPEAEGHGTDAVISAYHSLEGRIRKRVPIIKTVASALTIGMGGSGGREGPIAQIGAGFGVALAEFMNLRSVDRRILMAAGMGAGIAAIFRAPLAGALFAAEVLYRSPEFEPEVILPAAIASVVSFCTFGLYAGWSPLFHVPELAFHNPLQLAPYLFLVVFMILLAAAYTNSFYGFVGLFKKVPIKPHFRPALGAFLTGLLGLGLYYFFGQRSLAVLGFGYSALQSALTDPSQMTIWLLLAIAVGKILTTGLTIGSGGSGGVFGPSMVIGGCGGAALGLFLHRIWPGLVPQSEVPAYALVGMAGFFAAAAKTPFSTLIIVSEMTGGYHMLLPALWVCALAYIFSDKTSIYSSQVETRSRSPVHQGQFVREILAEVHVRRLIKPASNVPLLRPGDSLEKAMEAFDDSLYPVLPVVAEADRLLGLVDLEELHLASQSAHATQLILVADMMLTDIHPLHPDDTLDRALELFVDNDLQALPIVETIDNQQRYLGMVRRYEIASQYLQRIHPLSRLKRR